MSKPVVTIENMHVCPMVSGLVPHVGGPVIGPGCPGVLVDGMPISIMGDQCVCMGPPDVVIEGCSGVLADGTPIILMGAKTAHGGSVVQGVVGVSVGSSSSSVYPNIKDIPFPEFNKIKAALTGNKAAAKAIEETKEEAKENSFLSDLDFSI